MKTFAFVLLLAFAVGCNNSPSNQTEPNQPEPTALAAGTDSEPTALAAGPRLESTDLPTAINDDRDTDITVTDSPDSTGLDEINSVAGPAASAVGSQTESETGKSEYEHGLREGSHRLLLPTTAGILIVDVEIEINGNPIQQNFDSRLDSVIQNAAEDVENPTWPELFRYVAANQTKFGVGIVVNRPQFRQMQGRYDQNRNNRPDRPEVAKYLFQNSSTSSPFRLFGTDSFRGTNRSTSPVFEAIDADDNHVLDDNEIRLSVETLQTLDRNSDQRIDSGETMPVPIPMNMNNATDHWKRRRSKRWGEVAMDLSGHIDWSMLSYMIGDLSRPGPFGQTSDLLATLDLDNDKSVSANEAAGLMSIDPDLRIHLGYSAGGQETINIESISPEIESLVETNESSRQVHVWCNSFKLVVQVMPSLSQTNQFPDQAFVMLDANADGFLDENEIPELALQQYSFDDIDGDDDGKLTIEEIRTGLAGEEPFCFVQVRARGAESPDAVFQWFDQNHDYFLSTREIKGVPALLRSIAINGSVSAGRIPDTYLVQFGRGEPSQDTRLFTMTSTTVETIDDRPRWAQAMDSNRDGDISRDEFTGTGDRFDAIDHNRDGFIDPQETASL